MSLKEKTILCYFLLLAALFLALPLYLWQTKPSISSLTGIELYNFFCFFIFFVILCFYLSAGTYLGERWVVYLHTCLYILWMLVILSVLPIVLKKLWRTKDPVYLITFLAYIAPSIIQYWLIKLRRFYTTPPKFEKIVQYSLSTFFIVLLAVPTSLFVLLSGFYAISGLWEADRTELNSINNEKYHVTVFHHAGGGALAESHSTLQVIDNSTWLKGEKEIFREKYQVDYTLSWQNDSTLLVTAYNQRDSLTVNLANTDILYRTGYFNYR